jgi:hypothetical protein
MYLTTDRASPCVRVPSNSTRTLKSTPIVALASSSGNHCLSEKRRRRLLFPTDEFPISSSLTLISSCGRDGCGVGAMIVRCALCVCVLSAKSVVLGNKVERERSKRTCCGETCGEGCSSWVSVSERCGVGKRDAWLGVQLTASQGPRGS